MIEYKVLNDKNLNSLVDFYIKDRGLLYFTFDCYSGKILYKQYIPKYFDRLYRKRAELGISNEAEYF